MARLQEIFTYTFAPKEVYFNARWCYFIRLRLTLTPTPTPNPYPYPYP